MELSDISDELGDVCVHDTLGLCGEIHLCHPPCTLKTLPLPLQILLSLPGQSRHTLVHHHQPPNVLRGGDKVCRGEGDGGSFQRYQA